MLEETDMQKTKLWALGRGYLSCSCYMLETVQSSSKYRKAQSAWLCQGEGDCAQAISSEVSLEKWVEFVDRKSTDHLCILDRRKTAWAMVSDDMMWMGPWVALGERSLNCIEELPFPAAAFPVASVSLYALSYLIWAVCHSLLSQSTNYLSAKMREPLDTPRKSWKGC